MPDVPTLTPTITEPTGLSKRKRVTEEFLEPYPETLISQIPRKRLHLRITIPPSDIPTHDTTLAMNNDLCISPISGLSDHDSLFDEPTSPTFLAPPSTPILLTPALLTAPLIQGLFFTPSLRLPEDLADSLLQFCFDTYFHSQGINQVMLFGRFPPPQPETVLPTDNATPATFSSGLPPPLLRLLDTIEAMLLSILPHDTHRLLFPRVPTQARQAILNLYQPGEGISPHVDLLRRFDDGIIGISLGSGCVMQFAKVDAIGQSLERDHDVRDKWDVYLPERSVIVLSEDARYGWTHGIGRNAKDYVTADEPALEGAAGRWIQRGIRLSITFRWLLPGADIVGEEEG